MSSGKTYQESELRKNLKYFKKSYLTLVLSKVTSFRHHLGMPRLKVSTRENGPCEQLFVTKKFCAIVKKRVEDLREK